MKEPLTEGKNGEKAFSWIYKLAGKNKSKGDDISPALRAHAEAEAEHEGRNLSAPQRSRSVSVAQAEKKDTRRKSLADVFSMPARVDPGVKKTEDEKATKKKEIAKQTDAEKALAKAKKAEEQALAARNEATRLIAEANKAFAAAAKAAAEAHKTDIELSIDQSRVSTSASERGTSTELEISNNSAREDSEKKNPEETAFHSMSSSSTLNLSQFVEDSKDNNNKEKKSDSPRESTSRGGFFSSLSKKIAPGHAPHLCVEGDESRSGRAEREIKLRAEYALVAEKAAKKAIKQATKAKHEAEHAATKAHEAETLQLAKEAKRRGRSPKGTVKKHELEVHHDETRKSTSFGELERTPSSNSLIPSLTLNEVLASDAGVAAFKQFAAEGFVLENVSFVLEVRAFDSLDESVVGTDVWRARAREIFNNFVLVGSPQEVNVTSKTRKDVVEKFEADNIGPGIFKGLATEALRIVRTNDWPRFVKSEQYKQLETAAGLADI